MAAPMIVALFPTSDPEVALAQTQPPAPRPSPSPTAAQQQCVTWTIPDLRPSAEAQARMNEFGARRGGTVTQVKPARQWCFATAKERDDWHSQNQGQYSAWLQSQPEFQEYVRSRSANQQPRSSSGTSALSADPAIVYLHDGYGYAAPSEYYVFPGGCDGGQSWGVWYVGNGINDRTSSATVNINSTCGFWAFYDAFGYGTPADICQAPDAGTPEWCWYVGNPMNDRTSSFIISFY